MSKAFYRKYRSKKLSEVVGQDHITNLLELALKHNKTGHAYLFTGPRGVGKTSVARILAHEINKLPYVDDASHLDIIEIDAASNNSVDDIRELRERVQLTPLELEKKIYIIDEVHMLSKSAFNALLKTLEEPPRHVVFILATTDIDKLPETIISRTQRFNFRTIPISKVTEQLRDIAKAEGFKADRKALEAIAKYGEGSFRDSISLLDQLHSFADKELTITLGLVENFLGLPPSEIVKNIIRSYGKGDYPKIINILKQSEDQGIPASRLANSLIEYLKPLLSDGDTYVSLLDKLILVNSSSRPDIKLLIALEPPKSSRAIVAPTIELVASDSEASDEITLAADNLKKNPSENNPAASLKTSNENFAWPNLLADLKKTHLATFTVIAKCNYTLDSDGLTIYTGTNFYKKKLETPKYRTTLVDSLEKLGFSNLPITIIGKVKPPNDTVMASVTALMGGGEEIALTEEF